MLKRSRWLLLKRPEKLTGEQRGRLAELVRRNLRTVRAYLLKEDFQSLWGYVSPYWAGQFLDRWCTRTMRSRLDPMKEVARMVALAPRPDSELVPSPGAVLQWRCRRLQRKGQSDHQTGVWVPHLRGTGSRFVSRTWRPARTKTHPQILLTRPAGAGQAARCSDIGGDHEPGLEHGQETSMNRITPESYCKRTPAAAGLSGRRHLHPRRERRPARSRARSSLRGTRTRRGGPESPPRPAWSVDSAKRMVHGWAKRTGSVIVAS